MNNNEKNKFEQSTQSTLVTKIEQNPYEIIEKNNSKERKYLQINFLLLSIGSALLTLYCLILYIKLVIGSPEAVIVMMIIFPIFPIGIISGIISTIISIIVYFKSKKGKKSAGIMGVIISSIIIYMSFGLSRDLNIIYCIVSGLIGIITMMNSIKYLIKL